jgi:NUMOD3 motif
MPRDPVKAEETRQKMRGARKLRLPASQETRKKLSDARKGKSNSEETRKRMRGNIVYLYLKKLVKK